MNIDKEAMEAAWIGRSDPRQYDILMGYIDEIARFFASRLKINENMRDDILQEVRLTAADAIEKYQIQRKSTIFSFEYRTIYIAMLYFLRKDYNKNKRRITTCSYDVISNTIGDDVESENPYEPSYVEEENQIISIDGNIYLKEEICEAAGKAKKLCKKKVDLSSIDDPLVLLCAKKLLAKKEARKK